MSPSSTLIVGAAPESGGETFYRELLGRAARVIAADGAGEWCAGLGRLPDIVLGDFDSATPGADTRLADAGVRVVRLSLDKDLSDLDACVLEARRLGWAPVTLTAAFVGRLDHTLAALGAVMRATDLDSVVEEPAWTGTPVGPTRPWTCDMPAGALFSVLASAGADGVSIRGARYALDGARLEPLSSLGVSNVASGGYVTVSVALGTALVIVQRAPAP